MLEDCEKPVKIVVELSEEGNTLTRYCLVQIRQSAVRSNITFIDYREST